MRGSETHRSTRLQERLWSVFLGLLLVSLPVSLDLLLVRGAEPTARIRIPIADALLLGAVPLALAVLPVRARLIRHVASPAFAVVGVGTIATLPQLSDGASWSDLLQRVDHFLISFTIAIAVPMVALRRLLGPMLTIATIVLLVIAAIQIVLDEPVVRVTSAFENRHLFAGWTAIAVALCSARAPYESVSGWLGAAALILLALVTATTLLPLVGLFIGSSVASCSRAGWQGLGLAGAISAVAVAVFVTVAPQTHARRSLEEWSVEDAADLATLRDRGAEVDALTTKLGLGSLRWGDREIQFLLPNWHPRSAIPRDPRREARFEPDYVRQRYLEWQAALYATSANPVLGTGLGSYQARISGNYRTFKKLKTLEPDTQSAYAVELVSTGLAGLVVLISFLAKYCGEAFRRVALTGAESEESRCVLAGLSTSGVLGLAIPLYTCSLAVVVVLLAALGARSGSEGEPMSDVEGVVGSFE